MIVQLLKMKVANFLSDVCEYAPTEGGDGCPDYRDNSYTCTKEANRESCGTYRYLNRKK